MPNSLKLTRNTFLFGAAAALLTAPSGAGAQTIKEVQNSEAYIKLKDGPKARRRPPGEKGSNYRKVFSGKNGAQIIFSWLGDNIEGFKKERTNSDSERAYVRAFRQYSLPLAKKKKLAPIEITFYLPRPDMADAVELGMYPEIRKLTPPDLAVEKEESLRINGYDSQLFVHRNYEGCSLVTRTSRGGWLSLYTSDCKQTPSMLELFEQFNLGRLNQKLES